jgi:DNA mismatch repair protein MutS
VFDRIFTRVGAADDLTRGQSTFMVEMSEAANILRNATQKSLVILDEVGRCTSTQDGLAIASAILLDLARRVRCYSLFATHYHELVPLAETLPSVRAMQTEVLEQGGRIVFSHRLKDGASDSSYGLEVARIAGLPESVLAEAARLVVETPHGVAAATSARPIKGATAKDTDVVKERPLERMGLASNAISSRLHERLVGLNLNRLTPIQALNILAEMQAEATRAPQRALFPEESC